ncbi:NADH-quinone oxidoreductase subunit NuoB [Holophaga foetida]|uniref:NADH-quinone oxidoreductase subunit NuoB n=1 Tax=Holophaga foetida TaxID=35839 RepID=UPI000247462D|nr:NADH-quinone oxidoreductase subunit NuoB [Holophaga foetida]
MIQIMLSRWRQGHRTLPYPKELPPLPPRLRGLPRVGKGACPPDCRGCAEACPTQAIEAGPEGPRFDLGRCLFCLDCTGICPKGALHFSPDHRLATRTREDLLLKGDEELRHAEALEGEPLSIFRDSLKLRVVSAGGCNGCEVDTNVLGTLAWDLGRFGIQFVASPRHADGMLLCGPVTANMELAVRKTYDAIPDPKLVIAIGACAISGGPYRHQEEQLGGTSSVVPVDLFVPGCPPHPLTILDGLLRLQDKVRD